MPITVVSEEKKIDGFGITKKQIQGLVDNYRATFEKKDKNGVLKPLDAKVDSKYVSFTMQEILDLLKANNFDWRIPEKYELRIYFGAHSNDPKQLTEMRVPTQDVSEYLRQQTAIIVVAEPMLNELGKFRECLEDKDAVSVAGIGSNEGLEVGNLCPPKCADYSVIN